MIEFGKKEATVNGLKFGNEAGEELVVAVHDKFPEMDDVHIEGRRYVEVSVEMFITLVQAFGWTPVAPAGEGESE